MKEKFEQEQVKTAQEMLSELNFSELSSHTMQIATRLGARRVLDLHGVSEEELKIDLKPESGMTPVTEADRLSGDIIKQLILREYPNDSINEEETGLHKGENRIWYVDPLDGTSSFTREQKYSSVGIAVYEKGKPFSATICHPFERELLVAEVGKGAFSFALDEKMAVTGEPRKIEVSNRKSLKGGVVYLDALFNKKTVDPKLKLLKKIVQSVGNLGIRMTGSNIDQQRQVASGRAEASITDAVGGFYDLAVGSLIIEEAGGKFCNIDGQPVDEDTQVAIGGNKEVVKKILPLVKECYEQYKGFK